MPKRTEHTTSFGKTRIVRDVHDFKGQQVGRVLLGGSEILVSKVNGVWAAAVDVTWNDFYSSDEWQLVGDAIKLRKS
jgi:hypothetical protein